MIDPIFYGSRFTFHGLRRAGGEGDAEFTPVQFGPAHFLLGQGAGDDDVALVAAHLHDEFVADEQHIEVAFGGKAKREGEDIARAGLVNVLGLAGIGG